MAKTIKTTFALDGDAEYTAKIKKINAQLGLYKSELSKVDAQYEHSANSLEALTAKQAVLSARLSALNEKHAAQTDMLERARKAQQEYAQQADQLQKRLEALKAASGDTGEEQEQLAKDLAAAKENMDLAEAAAVRFQKALNETQRDQYKLGDELGRTAKYLDEARQSADGCAASIDKYGREVEEGARETGNLGKETDRASNGIQALASALAAAGIGMTVREITRELLACSQSAASLETAIAKLSTLMVPFSMEPIKAELMELSNETGINAKVLAETAYQARSAGVDAAEVMSFVATAAKTSVAGFTESATAVDVLTTAINAYNLEGREAERVASMLVKTQDEGKTTVGELAQNMGRVIPVAAAYNVGLSNLTTSYALLTKSGTNTAIATTNLTALFNELGKTGSNAAKVLEKETGKSFAQLMGEGKSLSEVISILSDSVEGDTTAFSNLWGSTTAGQAALSLLNAGAEEFDRTLQTMENSSGAVERSFQTMADTTEMARARMSAAAENLRVAIGDALNPALNALAGAGSAAFGWAADFVRECPGLVQMIAGAAGAVVLAAGALGGYTAAAAAAKAIQDQLNLSISLCPILGMVAAAGALAGAIAGVMSSTDGAAGSTQAFTKSLEDSKKAYEDLKKSMAEEKKNALDIAKALDTLMEKEEKTAGDKAAIRGLVDDLNEAVPGLTLAYNEQADALEGLSAANAASCVEAAAAAAQQAADEDRLSELLTEREETARKLAEAQEKLAEAESHAGEVVQVSASSYSAAAGAATDWDAVAAGLRGTIDELSASLDNNEAEYNTLSGKVEEYAQAQRDAAQAASGMTPEIEGIIGSMSALAASYDESYQKALESINGQMGLFEEMDGKAKTTADELIKTLEGQASYLDEYAANLQKAMEMGVDEGLVKQLSDGSQESAQILDAIVKGGKDKVDELNKEFARVEEGKEQFAGAVAEMETDFKGEMGEMTQDLQQAIIDMDYGELAEQIGRNNIQGLINGAQTKMNALIQQYAQMGDDALAAYKKAVGQASPSKKFAQAGAFDVQGIITGAEQLREQLAEAYAQLGRMSMEGYAAGVSEAAGKALGAIQTALGNLDSLYATKSKVADLEYQLWERTDGRGATDLMKYTKQLETLTAKQENQRSVVEAAEDAYKAVVSQYGEACQASYEYQQRLLEEKLALQDILDEINQVNRAKGQAFIQEAEERWASSPLGIASATALDEGITDPYRIAELAKLDVVDKMAVHLPATVEEPRQESGTRSLERVLAASVNAITDSVSAGRDRQPISVKMVLPDGTEFASYYFDPLTEYADANGTPILKPGGRQA